MNFIPNAEPYQEWGAGDGDPFRFPTDSTELPCTSPLLAKRFTRRGMLILLGLAGIVAVPSLACGGLSDNSGPMVSDECWEAAKGSERRALNNYIFGMRGQYPDSDIQQRVNSECEEIEARDK